MEKAIRKAIEGGYKWQKSKINLIKRGGELRWDHGDYTEKVEESSVLLDPLFWKALGKAENWGEFQPSNPAFAEWKVVWHNFIDHISQKGKVDMFFKKIFQTSHE